MTTTCPVCGRAFRDAHGRGGHLATYNDEAHDAFRQSHGLKHPLGPDGMPTVVGARWRGPESPSNRAATLPPTVGPAPVRETAVSPPVPKPSLERVLPPVAPLQPQPAPARLRAVPPAPSATPAPAEPALPARKETPPPSPTGEGAPWIPLGLGVGALAALVLAKKGSHAPTPVAPQSTVSRKDPFRGIWAQPEPVQSTGFPYVDRMLGYSGAPRVRRRPWP